MEFTASGFLQNCFIQELLHQYARRCRFSVTSFWVDSIGNLVASEVAYDPHCLWKNAGGDQISDDDRMVKEYVFKTECQSAKIEFGAQDASAWRGDIYWLELRPLAYWDHRYKKWVLTDSTFDLPCYLPNGNDS